MELSTENMHQGIAYTLHTVNGGGARVFVRILFSFHETDSGTSTMFSRTKNVVFTKFEFLERRVLASTQTSCVLYPDKNRILLNVSHFTKQKNHSDGKPSGEDQKTPQGGMIRMCCLHILWKNRMAPIENGMVFSCHKMEHGME